MHIHCAQQFIKRSAKLGCGKSKTDSPVHNSYSSTAKNKMVDKSGSSLLFPATNSQQTVSAGTESRQKVALKPGRSLMDWIRLSRSGQDLTGVGGQTLNVTLEELAKHNTPKDAWMAIRGKIYNISPYLEYHPGGQEELMRGAGIDGTQLFDEIHKWVNAESMLEKCYVGKLLTDLTSRKGSTVSRSSKSSKGSISPNILTPSGVISKAPPTFSQASPPQIPVYDWFQNSKALILSIYTRWKQIQPEHITVDKADRDFLLTVVVDKFVYTAHIELEEDVTTDYVVKVHTESGKVEVTLPKCKPEYTWKTLGKSLPWDKSFLKASEKETVFREGEVVSVSQVTHDTKLLCIAPPHGSRICVPIGHHIHIKHTVLGMEITRSYTSVLPSLIQDNQDPRVDQGTALYLLIKIYPNGALTPWIETLQPGNKIHFSGSTGTFDLSQLAGVTHLFLFAAGTGFTPMMRIIYHTVTSEASSKMQVHLMFYNKKEQDIFWRHELDFLASTSSRFQVTYILSEATENWTGLRGQVCKAHLADQIPVIEDSIKPLLCVCGPKPFTELVISLAKSLGLQDTNLHAFLG